MVGGGGLAIGQPCTRKWPSQLAVGSLSTKRLMVAVSQVVEHNSPSESILNLIETPKAALHQAHNKIRQD